MLCSFCFYLLIKYDNLILLFSGFLIALQEINPSAINKLKIQLVHEIRMYCNSGSIEKKIVRAIWVNLKLTADKVKA